MHKEAWNTVNDGLLLSRVRAQMQNFPEAQRRVARYILENSESVVRLTITELASSCGTSETTVVRLLRKLGYDSYQVFRVDMAQQVSSGTNWLRTFDEIQVGDSTAEIVAKVIGSTSVGVQDAQAVVSEPSIDAAVTAVLNAQCVFVTGVGSSAYVAGDLYHKLLRLGIRATTSSDPHMAAIHATHLTERDLLVCVSHSGESESILHAIEAMNDPRPTVVALTSYSHSSLAEKADHVLLSSSAETKFRPDAMLSRIIQLVIVDILNISCAMRMGTESAHAIRRSQLAVARQKR